MVVALAHGKHIGIPILATAAQRQRWHREFMAPVEAALQQLPARGVRVQSLAGDAPSDAWLPLLGGARAA